MKTISDFLKALKEDEDLAGIVLGCELLHRDYKPKKRRYGRNRWKGPRTRISIAADNFWDSLDGAKLRLVLETKYNVNVGDTQSRGALKDALILYLSEVVGE